MKDQQPKGEEPILPSPGESQGAPWDNPKDFHDYLLRERENLLEQVREFGRGGRKTKGDTALFIYLDAVLKEYVYGMHPFASKRRRDRRVQADRRTIAYIAAEEVAKEWLVQHPGSEAAMEVSHLAPFASPDTRISLLREMWPYIVGRLNESQV